MAVTAVADILYVLQIEADTYVEGGQLDGLWLVAYALFVLTAFLVARPAPVREQADRPARYWQMLAPYSAILMLFAMTLWQIGGQATTLQVATATVGMLVIARQGVAIRETRDVIEEQRNDLVASISHELRTPLTAMSGFTEILRDNPDLDRNERVEMVGIVDTQTRHITRIVGDLVQVARGDLDTTDLNYTAINVDDLVSSAIGMLTNGAAQTDITTDLLPGWSVWGDKDRIGQVLVNYLTNAERYGNGNAERYGNGKAEVVARRDHHEVIVEVHDNGPGVPKKHELTIWDRFERGPHRFMSQVQGSGLGLAIARQLVHAHGGLTGYRRSEHLQGSCFWFTVATADDELQTPPHDTSVIQVELLKART